MTALKSFGVLVALTVMLGGCMASNSSHSSSEENLGASAESIMGGYRATAYPEAALIDMNDGMYGCSGSLIAPRVILTAGHCVYNMSSWVVLVPYAPGGARAAKGSGAALYDWANDSDYVEPSMHDVGLIFLDRSIALNGYPTIASSALANGSSVVNVGRINDGASSDTDLYVSDPVSVRSGSSIGFPYDYEATDVIESGDSGGPGFAAGTHKIVAVNSGGGSTEVLARVDLLHSWIQQQVASHSGGATGSDGSSAACAHDICSAGGVLTSRCDPCAARICAQDSYCCSTSWDSQCVRQVASVCGESCSN